MFCEKCGSRVDEGSMVCPSCGFSDSAQVAQCINNGINEEIKGKKKLPFIIGAVVIVLVVILTSKILLSRRGYDGKEYTIGGYTVSVPETFASGEINDELDDDYEKDYCEYAIEFKDNELNNLSVWVGNSNLSYMLSFVPSHMDEYTLIYTSPDGLEYYRDERMSSRDDVEEYVILDKEKNNVITIQMLIWFNTTNTEKFDFVDVVKSVKRKGTR